ERSQRRRGEDSVVFVRQITDEAVAEPYREKLGEEQVDPDAQDRLAAEQVKEARQVPGDGAVVVEELEVDALPCREPIDVVEDDATFRRVRRRGEVLREVHDGQRRGSRLRESRERGRLRRHGSQGESW